ncbi:MAG: hypothetical protein IPK07_23610 [Deltaproteobacteria bacterium]|nr:hypothetical protein [Deltaproteobacteria bacterium]
MITDLSSIPYAFDGQVAVFPPSVVFPTQTSIVPGVWLQANGLTAGFPFGGGALPRSVSGSGLDVDADGVADQLEVVFVNDDATQFPMTLPRTDPYTDYRCWKGHPTCEAVAGPPSCAFTARGAERYDLHAEIPFRDEGDHMNPGGTLRVQVVDAVTPSYEAVPVPGTFTSGSTVYSTSAVGTTQGLRGLAARCAGIALLVLVLRQHAAAQSGALAPTPDAPNQVQFTVTYDVYAPHDWTSALSQRSWVAFAYDPLAHRLEVRDLHLFPDDVPLWCFGFHACFGYCAIDIALDPAVPPPVAALSPEGHLSLAIPVQMTYRPAFATVRCDQSWVETDPGTLSMTGTFRYDAATGEVSLADFLGSGEWGIVGGLAHLEVTSNFGGFTPVLDSLPDPVRVGAAIELSGAGISPGSLLKVFVATASGAVDVLPSGIGPTATSATTWTGTLPGRGPSRPRTRRSSATASPRCCWFVRTRATTPATLAARCSSGARRWACRASRA